MDTSALGDGDDFNGSHRIVDGHSVDVSQWPTPDEGALRGRRRTQYFARKRAVSLYLIGAPADLIKRRTSMSAKQAYRLIRERCLETHPDGLPYGWRGLVPWLRIQPYRRRKKIVIDRFGGGAAGALQTLLDCLPKLRKEFDTRIRAGGSKKRLVEVKCTVGRHCAWFLNQLRALGYEARNEWPFNTSSLGYFSIRRYIARVRAGDPKALAEAAGGPDLVAKLKTGDGTRRPVLRFMQRVEMDAHKLDGRFCVSLPLQDGDFKEKIVHRLWVIVILEVVSRVVLGYYFSMRREVSQDDVSRAIKRALRPWSVRPVTFCDTPYLPGAGLLSTLGNEFVGLCWDETSVDGALTETSKHVRDSLRDVVDSDLLTPETSFSKRRSKDDRPFIETYFRNLAGGGFQRMSNTTGAKPQDRNGREPEAVALASRFQYEYAEELLDVLIANYNASPHAGIGGRTPLAYAKFLYQHSELNFRHADPERVSAILSTGKPCKVRGGAQTGRGPFVEFYYAHYTNDVLKNRQDLVGSKIWVACHEEDDCRIARASTLDGISLGVLHAAPPWNASPHSLSVRTAICQASARGKFAIPTGGDAIEAFMEYVESHAHGKLPVHPAYLEARRILSAANNTSVGAAMLDAAIARTKAADSDLDTASGEADPSVGAGVKPGNVVMQLPAGTVRELPPRRMARGK